MMIEELLALESFSCMLLNPYGNYVIQKALEQAAGKLRTRLLKVKVVHKQLEA